MQQSRSRELKPSVTLGRIKVAKRITRKPKMILLQIQSYKDNGDGEDDCSKDGNGEET
jgi:hypothetical protein